MQGERQGRKGMRWRGAHRYGSRAGLVCGWLQTQGYGLGWLQCGLVLPWLGKRLRQEPGLRLWLSLWQGQGLGTSAPVCGDRQTIYSWTWVLASQFSFVVRSGASGAVPFILLTWSHRTFVSSPHG